MEPIPLSGDMVNNAKTEYATVPFARSSDLLRHPSMIHFDGYMVRLWTRSATERDHFLFLLAEQASNVTGRPLRDVFLMLARQTRETKSVRVDLFTEKVREYRIT